MCRLERDRQRERDRQTDRDRQGQRQRKRKTETERDRESYQETQFRLVNNDYNMKRPYVQIKKIIKKKKKIIKRKKERKKERKKYIMDNLDCEANVENKTISQTIGRPFQQKIW